MQRTIQNKKKKIIIIRRETIYIYKLFLLVERIQQELYSTQSNLRNATCIINPSFGVILVVERAVGFNLNVLFSVICCDFYMKEAPTLADNSALANNTGNYCILHNALHTVALLPLSSILLYYNMHMKFSRMLYTDTFFLIVVIFLMFY